MNLYQTLAHQFPADRQACAIEAWGPAQRQPDRPLYYTWDDLEHGSARIANLLAGFGLPIGSRVLMQVEKSVEALMLYLGALRAGLVTVPLNTAYQAEEIEYFIGDAVPSIAVCSPGNFTWLSKLAFQRGTQAVFTLGDDRSGSLLERAAHCSDEFETIDLDDFELAAILYTSGTTGRSKGAMLSHVNLASNAAVLREVWGWRYAGWSDAAEAGGRDVLLNALPLFHVHGLFVACHGALMSGAKQIFLPKLDTKKVLELLPRCTVMMGVPTFYVRLLLEPGLDAEVCHNMRLFISGSAPLLVETFNEFRHRTGHTILERYGMSETVMLTSNPYHGDPAHRKAGTVGQPLPGVDVRIMNGVHPCATGHIGGIEVRGPNVFKGYWRMPEKTEEEFAVDASGTRWFKTGDLGCFDDAGYLSIVGRGKDLIISGGFNVYPREIEGYIDELPGVSESAVIGVPHPDFGEAVVAVLVARPDAYVQPEAIIAALKHRIANFKVPKAVHVVDELPRNTMGKVQKNLLRKQFGD